MFPRRSSRLNFRAVVLGGISEVLKKPATGCRVFESSGNPEIDRETCRLAETRLRFRPAVDEQGRPYVETYGYRQAPTR